MILIAVGLGALVYGSTPASVSETDPIPPGWLNFNEFQWAVLAGGTVQGTFASANGTPVQVLVYNDADYGSFVNGANLSGLYNVTAVSGTISLSVPGFDTYHVVFQHGAGYENTTQDVSIVLTTTGSDPTFTIAGILALVIGGLLLVCSVTRSRHRDVPPDTFSSPATIPASPAPPPSRPDTTPSGPGVYRVPPPLPGDAAGPPAGSQPEDVSPAAAPPPSETAKTVTGTVLVTVVNRSAADMTLQLLVNGVAVTSMTVRGGQSEETSVSTRLASPFGSMVTVEAVTSDAKRYRSAVFVGGRGTAPLTLRVG